MDVDEVVGGREGGGGGRVEVEGVEVGVGRVGESEAGGVEGFLWFWWGRHLG